MSIKNGEGKQHKKSDIRRKRMSKRIKEIKVTKMLIKRKNTVEKYRPFQEK